MEDNWLYAITAQVAVGLSRGESQGELAQASLMAIGLMLLQAYPDDPFIKDILASPTSVVRLEDGGLMAGPAPGGAEVN